MFDKRTSVVNQVKLISLGSASMFEIGDSNGIQSYTRALAVQRERELFYSNEGNLENYDIFSQDIPFEPLTEILTYESTHIVPCIKVNNINITACSTSAVFHIGSTKNIYTESRIKHIRHLQRRE